jgi:hypothetical protein
MSKPKGAEFEIVIIEGAIRVTHAERTMTVRCCVNDFDEEDDDTDVIVYLDDIQGWDPPHDKDKFEIDDLQKLLEAIEVTFAHHGLGVVFD